MSEDNLLNMVEKKQVRQAAVQKEGAKDEQKPMQKQEESSNIGTYLISGLIILGELGAAITLRALRKKKKRSLKTRKKTMISLQKL